jgi:hypothetical protein
MTTFEYEQHPDDLPDRAFILADNKYHVVLIRTDDGLVVDVYPQGWDCPIATMTVWDEDVAELENQDG